MVYGHIFRLLLFLGWLVGRVIASANAGQGVSAAYPLGDKRLDDSVFYCS